MRRWIYRLVPTGAALAGLLAGNTNQLHAQYLPVSHPAPSCLPAPSCPAPFPASGVPSATTTPGTAPGAAPNIPSPVPSSTEPTTQPPVSGQEQSNTAASAVGGESAVVAPNVIGNLIGAGKTVQYFFFPSQGGGAQIMGQAGVRYINPAIAENESPLPQDRIAYDFNYFHNSISVTGINNTFSAPQTRYYGVELHTFRYEKTFLDGLFSIEARLPFQTTLSSTVNSTTGMATGTQLTTNSVGTFPQFTGFNTPGETLGNERTEWGNMSLILKGVLYQNCGFFITAGASFQLPTARDENVTVTDFVGQQVSPTGVTPLVVVPASIERIRSIHSSNDTYGLTPFLAYLSAPANSKFFNQGFFSVECPLNDSNITFAESGINLNPTIGPLIVGGQTVPPPFIQTQKQREQTLMHVDWNGGYWLVKNNCSDQWLNGLAAMFELHYTTTLNDADIKTFPTDRTFFLSNGQPVPGLVVGNVRNRVDILDLTAGITALVANRMTMNVAASVPLLGGDNRTYDWEAHVQLNYYFGGPRYRNNFAPPF